MANRIQIRHGSGAPQNSISYELGWDTTNSILYINNGTSDVEIGSGRFLPLTGGTLAGNLTVNGSLTVTQNAQINGSLWAGTSTDTVERVLGVASVAGNLYLYAQGTATGTRGLFTGRRGSTQEYKAVLTIDADNYISLNGNALALTNKVLDSTTIDNTAGTFSFQGSGAPWTSTDWVGLQVDSGSDKFQIHAKNGTTLEYRQNDTGGTDSSNWGAWQNLLSDNNYTSYVVSVRDDSNGSAITFGYSKAGLNYADYTWLAAWNGYELRAVNKNQFLQSGAVIIGPATPCSWLNGQSGTYAPYNVSDATDSYSYWPWLRQTNTSSKKWFSFGTLGNSFYMIGSATTRTENGYDHGLYFDVSNGKLVVEDCAVIRDSGTVARKIFLTTSATKPSAAVAGDIVLVKV